jgi:medium-chain acyl-[acyl-carrier-protein] hydrolase
VAARRHCLTSYIFFCIVSLAMTPQKLWFPYAKENSLAKVRLFCFPYAGGAANSFRRWPDQLPPFVEVFALQLPGREVRIREKPFTRMEPMLEVITPIVRSLIDKPFALFGHSMGAMIVWELACELKRKHGLEPAHLCVSGRRAPQVPETRPPIHNLPDAEFTQELIRFNGLPREVIEHGEMMELIRPMLRADFEVCETYTSPCELRLGCPITVFGGVEDPDETRERIAPWCERTTKSCNIHMLPGDHFFLHSSEKLLTDVLSQELIRIPH